MEGRMIASSGAYQTQLAVWADRLADVQVLAGAIHDQ
jgi:hypothetical protein